MKMDNTILHFATLLVLFWTPHVTNGFVPNDLARFGLNAVTLSLDTFMTHEDITRNAILAVAAEVLKDNPNPRDRDSTQRIEALSSLDESILLTAYFGERISDSRIDEFEDAIEMIADANTDVDFDEADDASAHFDSEQFQLGQNRLVELRQMVVSQIILSNGMYDIARRETGRMFHTLQDFYSHSNWIESGNLVPYSVLGNPNERPENIAPPNMATCVDCEVDRRFLRIADFFGITESSTIYQCVDNLVSSLKQNMILTSGYIDEKPSGKCSHGGFRDSTTDSHATGGINKDSPRDEWSPHFYLFDEAIAVAEQATIDILKSMREDVGDDTKFGEYLGITVNQVTSIAYVVDTSASMAEELPEIQATIPVLQSELTSAFENGMQFRYILVPLNLNESDGLIFETEDINEFSSEIGELVAFGGEVSGNPTIGALIQALQASNIGSSVYVFTDNTPSDEELLNIALALITEKRITVTFVLSNMMMVRKRSIIRRALQFQHEHNRERRQLGGTDVYERIATFSGGQLLNVNTDDISEIGTLISFTALQTHNTILTASDVSLDEQRFTFPVDGSVDEIVVSISGEDIVTTLFNPQGTNAALLPEYTSILNSSSTSIATIDISDTALRGEWEVSLQSRGAYSIQVLGIGDLTFSTRIFGSSSAPTRSLQFRQIIGKPYEGQELIALFQVKGGSATPTALNLINTNGMVALSLSNLTELQDGRHFAQFNLPAGSFKLQLVGVDSAGFSFSHIRETSIESTTISLTLSEANTRIVTLRPGENSTVDIILNNRGTTSEFQLTVNTAVIGNHSDFFEYILTPETIILGEGRQSQVTVDINVFSNATDGLGVAFTVIAFSLADENVNEFITFDVVTTTVPPPMFNDNDFSGALSTIFSSGSQLMVVVILAITTLGITVCFN